MARMGDMPQEADEPPSPGIRIEISKTRGWEPYLPEPESFCHDLLERLMEDWAEHMGLDISRTPIELSLMMTNDTGITLLNRNYRGKDKATNVLSFPQYDDRQALGEALTQTEFMFPVMLGDIAVSVDTLAYEAHQQQKLFPYHLAHMLLHGLLHLLGYDHVEDDDAQEMEALEIAMLEAIGIDNPYKEDDSSS